MKIILIVICFFTLAPNVSMSQESEKKCISIQREHSPLNDKTWTVKEGRKIQVLKNDSTLVKGVFEVVDSSKISIDNQEILLSDIQVLRAPTDRAIGKGIMLTALGSGLLAYGIYGATQTQLVAYELSYVAIGVAVPVISLGIYRIVNGRKFDAKKGVEFSIKNQ